MHVSSAIFTSLKRGRRPLGRGGRTDTLPTSSSGTTPLLGRQDVATALLSSSMLEEQCMAEQGQPRLTDPQYWCIIILELHIFAIWYIFFLCYHSTSGMGIGHLPQHYFPFTIPKCLPIHCLSSRCIETKNTTSDSLFCSSH